MYINIHLCSSGAIVAVELLRPLTVAELYPYASPGRADSGGEGRMKKPSGKTGYIRFY
jgi:hypothetical protein